LRDKKDAQAGDEDCSEKLIAADKKQCFKCLAVQFQEIAERIDGDSEHQKREIVRSVRIQLLEQSHAGNDINQRDDRNHVDYKCQDHSLKIHGCSASHVSFGFIHPFIMIAIFGRLVNREMPGTAARRKRGFEKRGSVMILYFHFRISVIQFKK
jgi:hypothetical protein